MTNRVRWWTAGAAAVALALTSGCTGGSDRPAAPEVTAAAGSPVPSVATPSASASPVPSAAPASCADRTLDGLSAPERAGQVLMIGTPVVSPRSLGDVVAGQDLGGVFLAGRSTRSAARLRADIAALQKRASTPLLVSLDQEGGSVQTLKGADFPLIPSAQRLGAGSTAKLRATVRDSAQRLAGIGVTVNLAPVADTVPAKLGERNPPIGFFHRQYGADPEQVAEDITTVVAASQGEQVMTIVKHFPGLGRVRANTDTAVRVVDGTTTRDDPYLAPFVAGIKAGTAGVMISSAMYPRLDPKSIAAYSKPIITDLLRGRLGYAGLVMSDDLGAADAAASLPPGERAVRFVGAGGDLVLSIRPEDAVPMRAALTAQARKSPEFAARLTEAARHVLQTKERAGLLGC